MCYLPQPSIPDANLLPVCRFHWRSNQMGNRKRTRCGGNTLPCKRRSILQVRDRRSPRVSETKFSSRILRRFVEAVSVELGNDQFHGMLALSKVPAEWAKPETFHKMDSTESARIYAALQAA